MVLSPPAEAVCILETGPNAAAGAGWIPDLSCPFPEPLKVTGAVRKRMKRCRGEPGDHWYSVSRSFLSLIDLGSGLQVIFALATLESLLRLFLHLSFDVDVGRRGAVSSLKTSPPPALVCACLCPTAGCSRGGGGSHGAGCVLHTAS